MCGGMAPSQPLQQATGRGRLCSKIEARTRLVAGVAAASSSPSVCLWLCGWMERVSDVELDILHREG